MRADPVGTASRVVAVAGWTHVRVLRTKDLGIETDNDGEGHAIPRTQISRRSRLLQAGSRAGGGGDAEPARRPGAFGRSPPQRLSKWSYPFASNCPPPGSLISTPPPPATSPTLVSAVSAASATAFDAAASRSPG